jgi:pyruvate/2-oxoglutarate dehydrogenase complex dihydrolipoamide acyltransferase (E2) component
VPLRGIRREIARTMTASWQQIPHVTEFCEIDATQLVRAHRALRDRWPADRPRPTLLPILAMACVAALRRHPVLNASLDLPNETIRYHGAVHVGIATASPDGLTVPVVRDADRLGLADLAARIAAAVDAARAHRAGPEQLTGGTFTLTNFGSYGTWLGTPVINPPQAAIAGFGRIRDAVVAVDGQPVVRPTLPMAVSADHRLIDGNVLGAFVAEIAALLTDPVLLFASAG